MQTPSGGFCNILPPKGTPQPSLRLTRTALRTFRLLGSQPASHDAVLRYLKACYRVVRVGRSPLPGDGRPCLFLEAAVS